MVGYLDIMSVYDLARLSYLKHIYSASASIPGCVLIEPEHNEPRCTVMYTFDEWRNTSVPTWSDAYFIPNHIGYSQLRFGVRLKFFLGKK